MRNVLRWIGGIGAVSLVMAGPSWGEDPTWTVEGSLLVGHHDNFFFRGDNAASPASDLVQVSLDGERLLSDGRSEVVLVGNLGGTFVTDIDEADFQTGGVGLEVKRGPMKYAVGYSKMLNRLFSESGEKVFFDADSIEGWARRSLGPRWWVRAEVELDSWDFDAAENDRDSDTLGLGLTARYAVNERLGIRGSLLYEDRDAQGADQNRESTGFAVALEGRPRDDVDLFFRWRQRDREYSDAPVGTRNFGREDTVDDLVLNIRWQLDQRLALLLRNELRQGDSTRSDRNYDGFQILGGVAYRLTGGGAS